ncbi:MAG TPA: hypothetical protein VGB18_07150 [Candidatus Thermoplasmatota archaeon]|jgi:hypothetical protein
MTRCILFGIVLVGLGVFSAASFSQDEPSTTTPAVEAILDRLEAKGAAVDDLECSLTLEIQDPRTFELAVKTGKLLYRREEPNALFFVYFNKLEEGGARKNRKEWHLFDGRWYIEAREATKTVIKREIVGEGETLDPFELGKGPFPLPFGQSKAEILKHFRVELVPPNGDPAKVTSDHLKCMPRRSSPRAREYKELHFHVDRDLELPVKIVSHARKDGKTISATFTKLETNVGLARTRLSEDFPEDWARQIEPLKP